MAMSYEEELAKRRADPGRRAYQQEYRRKNREYFREYGRNYRKTYKRKAGDGYWGNQKADTNLRRCRAVAQQLYQASLSRSRKAGWPHGITREWLLDKLLFGRCELTGVPFVLERRSPFMPSLDRIDSNGVYDKQSCRLVLLVVNYAKNAWDEDQFVHALLAAADGIRAKRGPRSAPGVSE